MKITAMTPLISPLRQHRKSHERRGNYRIETHKNMAQLQPPANPKHKKRPIFPHCKLVVCLAWPRSMFNENFFSSARLKAKTAKIQQKNPPKAPEKARRT
jgi:hypothetical protein